MVPRISPAGDTILFFEYNPETGYKFGRGVPVKEVFHFERQKGVEMIRGTMERKYGAVEQVEAVRVLRHYQCLFPNCHEHDKDNPIVYEDR